MGFPPVHYNSKRHSWSNKLQKCSCAAVNTINRLRRGKYVTFFNPEKSSLLFTKVSCWCAVCFGSNSCSLLYNNVHERHMPAANIYTMSNPVPNKEQQFSISLHIVKKFRVDC